MDIVLRAARMADLPAMAAIDPVRGEPRRAEIASELVAAGMSWIAEVGGAAAGFALVSRHFYDRPFVDLLITAESHRRLGVGAALMAACAAAHDDDRIFTSTNESNAPMRALLAREGWQVSGVIENLDPGDPELVFVKFRRDQVPSPLAGEGVSEADG